MKLKDRVAALERAAATDDAEEFDALRFLSEHELEHVANSNSDTVYYRFLRIARRRRAEGAIADEPPYTPEELEDLRQWVREGVPM